jgi:hypothetical protein
LNASTASGCRRITFRISTMGDPMAQFRRVVEEVLPHVGEGTSPAMLA